jgi:hypothetical protein
MSYAATVPVLATDTRPVRASTESNGLQHGGVIAGANFFIARSIDDIQPTASELLSTERQEAPQPPRNFPAPFAFHGANRRK